MLKSSRRGDTLVEVLFSITIFALIAVITVNLMNNGIATAQKSLEITMTRNEIDAQAEALRFIHNSYLAEKDFAGGTGQYRKLWERITAVAQNPSDGLAYSFNNMNRCSAMYTTTQDYNVFQVKAFVLNTRLIQPDDGSGLTYDALLDQVIVGAGDNETTSKLQATSLYPRIIYGLYGSSGAGDSTNDSGFLKEQVRMRQIVAAQGIWVIAVKSATKVGTIPEYYDFYIRSCWQSVGRTAPSTIGTIVRLYNPDIASGGA